MDADPTAVVREYDRLTAACLGDVRVDRYKISWLWGLMTAWAVRN